MWGLSGPPHIRTPHFTGEVNDGVIQGAYRRFTAPGMTYHCHQNMPGPKAYSSKENVTPPGIVRFPAYFRRPEDPPGAHRDVERRSGRRLVHRSARG
jgi:hypothetical protein